MRTAAAFRRFPHQRTVTYENVAPAMCDKSSIRVVCPSVSRSRLDARMIAVPPSQREIRGSPTRPPRPNIDRFGRAGIRRIRLRSGAAVRAAVRWCTTSRSSCVITRPTVKKAQNDRVFLTVMQRDQEAERVATTTAGRGTIPRPALSVLMITL